MRIYTAHGRGVYIATQPNVSKCIFIQDHDDYFIRTFFGFYDRNCDFYVNLTVERTKIYWFAVLFKNTIQRHFIAFSYMPIMLEYTLYHITYYAILCILKKQKILKLKTKLGSGGLIKISKKALAYYYNLHML